VRRQPRKAGPAYKDWPPVGQWQVFLGMLPDGRWVCTAQRDAIQRNGYAYSLGFSFSGQESRLSILHIGPGAPSPAELSLQADGKPVASFAAISGKAFGPKNVLHPINALMPGDSYIRVVLPALSRARELTITDGDRRYSFNLAGLRRTTPDLAECARLAVQP